jgi:hypothetical protein
MKAVAALTLVALAITGCAAQGGVRIPTPGADSAAAGASTSTAIPDTTLAPTQQPNLGPRLILPASGGTPVFAIPLGGDIYLPVTGGVPVIGIALTP